jgi:hypothetical protein
LERKKKEGGSPSASESASGVGWARWRWLVEGYDEVRIQIDRRGNPIGCTIIHDATGRETIRPLDVGPFDTPHEVLEWCLQHYLTIQQTLW